MSAVVVRQNQYIRVFKRAGAITPGHAASLAELGQRESWIFRRMAAAGVFIAPSPGRYFLNVQAGEQFVARRRRRALAMLALILLLFAAASVMNWIFRG